MAVVAKNLIGEISHAAGTMGKVLAKHPEAAASMGRLLAHKLKNSGTEYRTEKEGKRLFKIHQNPKTSDSMYDIYNEFWESLRIVVLYKKKGRPIWRIGIGDNWVHSNMYSNTELSGIKDLRRYEILFLSSSNVKYVFCGYGYKHDPYYGHRGKKSMSFSEFSKEVPSTMSKVVRDLVNDRIKLDKKSAEQWGY